MKSLSYIFCIGWILFNHAISAQATFTHNDVVDLIDMLNIRHGYDELASEIEGSPFLNNLFVIGDIYYVDRPDIKNVPVRYNIYTDQIEYYHEERIMELLTYPEVEKISIGAGDTTLVYEHYTDGKDKVAGYFQLWYEGAASLLSKMSVKFYEKTSAKPLQDPKPAKFRRLRDSYYIKLPDGEVHKIQNMKKLISLFPDYRKELTDFAKERNISSGNTEELIEFLTFYDRLNS